MKLILFFLMFFTLGLICVTGLMGDSQESSTSTNSKLTVLYPKDMYFTYNSTFRMNLIVVNFTGAVQRASTYSCRGFFYSSQGLILLQVSTVDDGGGWNDYLPINRSVTSEKGWKDFTIGCNQTAKNYGYASNGFYITDTGEEDSKTGNGVMVAIIFIPLLLALLLILGGAFLSEQHSILKLLSYLMVLPFSWVSFNYGLLGIIKYNGFTELQISMSDTTYWLGWLFFVIITYVMIYFVKTAIEAAAQKKKARLEY